jgi:nucleoside phosphorylase
MPNTSQPKVDVLVVTVNERETKAIFAAFRSVVGKDPTPIPIDKRTYWRLGNVNGAEIYHALSEMGSGGVGGMQQTVDKAIRALRPAAVFAVGVAFGVDEEDQAIGDILFSTQLQLYELQRVGEKETVLRGDKPHASAWLINLLNSVAWTTWSGASVRRGLMLTGEKLVDNPSLRAKLIRLVPEAIGGEMEGAGLYVSSHDHHVDWIVVKAICDWAANKGEDKKARQEVAAKNAAEFVVHALQAVPVRHATQLDTSRLPKSSPSPEGKQIGPDASLLPAFTVLTECYQNHLAMMNTWRYAALNKMKFRDDCTELQRAELDKRAFNILPQLAPAIPPLMSQIVKRLRFLLNRSLIDPLELYYRLHDASHSFPRAPIDAAGTLHDDLFQAFSEMMYNLFRGSVDRPVLLDVLKRHHLDENIKTTREGPVFAVADVVILNQQIEGSQEIADALHAYGEWAKGQQ